MLRLEAETSAGALELSVSLEVDDGVCLALAGLSGSGKTTLLRIVAGLTHPRRGRVEANGASWLDTERGVNLPAERRSAGFVFQDYALFPHMSARDNVAYGTRDRARADDLLARFGIDAEARDRHPSALSGGERQRVALARALARDPAVLLLDEPLAALDPRTSARAARELAAALVDIAVPTLLVTHDFAEAATLGDEVAVIDGGGIVQRGRAAELSSRPASAFVADFTGAVVLTGTAAAAPDGLTAIALDGGGTVVSTDNALGRVAVSIHPWELALEPRGAVAKGSARNHLPVRVVSVTPLGNRARVGLEAPQPLTAELTAASATALGLRPGDELVATWKATATRVLEG